MPTEWGSSSIVRAQAQGYARILAEFGDNIRLIYLVSGADVPLMHPDALLAMPAARSYIGFTNAVLPKVSKARLAALGLSKAPNAEATQWVHLTPKHARMIAEYPIARLDVWHAALPAAKRDRITPDEVFPWAILLQTVLQSGRSTTMR